MQMNTHEQAMVITRVVPAIPCPHLHGRTPAQSSRLRSAGVCWKAMMMTRVVLGTFYERFQSITTTDTSDGCLLAPSV